MAGRTADLIVVIDASTFVSAALKANSLPERALWRAVDPPNRLILSQAVEDEYREVIFRRGVAEDLLKYTFAALLNEREEDLAFFDPRIEKGLVAKLEGIVGSQLVPMDYGEAIEVLERSNEKFEFPVKWGVDLQSEHERI